MLDEGLGFPEALFHFRECDFSTKSKDYEECGIPASNGIFDRRLGTETKGHACPVIMSPCNKYG